MIPHAPAVRIRTRAGELSKALGKLGHTVDVLTHSPQQPGLSAIGKARWHLGQLRGSNPPAELSPGVRAVSIKSCLRIPLLDRLVTRREMRRLAAESYDVIHTSAYERHRLSKPTRGRFVYDLVDDHADGYRRNGENERAEAIDAFIRDQIEAADDITVSALYLQQIVRERLGRDSHFVPNGVDLDAVRGGGAFEPGAEHRIGYMGGLDHYVKLKLVVQAMEQLRASGRPLELVVIGSGPAVENWTPPDWVKLRGFQPPGEIPRLMRSFKVGLLPFELCPLTDAALPLKVLEHGAARQWVVASPIRELQLQQFPWVKLAPLDADAWAAALRDALDAPWPAGADAVVAKFDWMRVAESLVRAVAPGAP